MQKNFNGNPQYNNPHFPGLKRIRQISAVHCGPAVLSMLLSHCGSEINQEALVDAADVRHSLEQYGMTVSEMGDAVKKVAPQLTLWYKKGTTIEEVATIIDLHKYPVGIEWQGVFYEDEDEDNGHYSIITNIDKVNKIISIADPYDRFAGTDRSFHIEEFETRWWDENDIYDPAIGERRSIRDERMVFIVTPKGESFPHIFEMIEA